MIFSTNSVNLERSFFCAPHNLLIKFYIHLVLSHSHTHFHSSPSWFYIPFSIILIAIAVHISRVVKATNRNKFNKLQIDYGLNLLFFFFFFVVYSYNSKSCYSMRTSVKLCDVLAINSFVERLVESFFFTQHRLRTKEICFEIFISFDFLTIGKLME